MSGLSGAMYAMWLLPERSMFSCISSRAVCADVRSGSAESVMMSALLSIGLIFCIIFTGCLVLMFLLQRQRYI